MTNISDNHSGRTAKKSIPPNAVGPTQIITSGSSHNRKRSKN